MANEYTTADVLTALRAVDLSREHPPHLFYGCNRCVERCTQFDYTLPSTTVIVDMLFDATTSAYGRA